MTDPLSYKVEKRIRADRLVLEDDLVVIALSGGPDSLFLLHLLNGLAEKLRFRLAVAHFDHKYRQESGIDARFAENTAKQFNLEFILGENQEKSKPKSNIQAAARKARYKFFDKILNKFKNSKIATAHTMNDSVETSILWMIRGSGPKAFGGIKSSRERFIRPIVDIKKDEILNWLGTRNIEFIKDKSNDLYDYRRNRIRKKIIPEFLNEEPGSLESIYRLSRLVREQAEFIEKIARDLLGESTDKIEIDKLILAEKVVRYSLYRLLLENKNLDERQLSFNKIENLDKMVVSKSFGKSVQVYAKYKFVLDQAGLYVSDTDNDPENFVFLEQPFTLPFEKKIPQVCTIKIMKQDTDSFRASSKRDPNRVYIDIDKLPADLLIRVRKEGDFIIKNGIKKSLKRYFIERKIALRIRNRLPLLASGDQIFFIAGDFILDDITADKTSKMIALLTVDF